jgi:hypothetical protein
MKGPSAGAEACSTTGGGKPPNYDQMMARKDEQLSQLMAKLSNANLTTKNRISKLEACPSVLN